MPSFDAGAVVEALDYDFTKAGVKAKGVVPEPTDAAIGRFLDGLKGIYAEAQKTLTADLPEGASPDEMLAALNQLSGDSFVKFMADTAGLFGELCSSKPDKDTLLALPLRVRVAFYGWIQGEVISPEAGTGGGTAVVRSLPTGRAG